MYCNNKKPLSVKFELIKHKKNPPRTHLHTEDFYFT